MKENDEIRMTNAELMTDPECCGSLCPERRDIANTGCAKVERVVLSALQKTAAVPPDICAFGDHTRIVFGEADPPCARRPYSLTRASASMFVAGCFELRHLVIPSSLDICHSSFSRRMSVPRHRMVA
jgi:hypothetical protein